MGYTQRDLDKLLEKRRARAVVRCRTLRSIAGGQPASDKGLKAFVEHHLGLEPGSKEFEEAAQRIKHEEIGEKETTPEGGELETQEVYQVNCLRSSERGSFVLEHQIKALIKQACSRLDLFVKKRGSKGDVAELGTVRAHGVSLQDPDRPWEIYLRDKNGEPAGTAWAAICGSVSTPKGKKSIMHHTEISEESAEFEFEFLWKSSKLGKNDFLMVMAAATQIGLGSCQSLGYGKFEVVEMEVELPAKEA